MTHAVEYWAALATVTAGAGLISQTCRSMLHLNLRRNIAREVVERKRQTVAERFALVLADLKLEYDLSPDVWAVAEDVLQVLRGREGKGY
jgi:hypothetical protein